MRAVVGLQAQDLGAAFLGVRARLPGSCDAADVSRALWEERSIARVWCMRGTLHLVAAADARWLVALLGPVGLARGRARRTEMGVDSPAAVEAVRSVLADSGGLTRHEIAAAAVARGVALADDPQAPAHLVGVAALHGVVCQVGVRDREPLYGLMDEWLGPAPALPDREELLVELARRYAAAHPPCGPEDFAAWSGLGLRDARRAFASIESSLEPVEVLGRLAFVPADLSGSSERSVRLLPAFDGFLLAHRDRALTVRDEHAREVLPGGGVLRPTVLVDGRVEGLWRLRDGRPDVSPFAPLPPGVSLAVEREAADVERFRAAR